MPSIRRRATTALPYDVSLSYADPEREQVTALAQALEQRGLRCHFDEPGTQQFWGDDLYDHLQHIHESLARQRVIVASAAYAATVWGTHARRSAYARAVRMQRDWTIPVRVDDTHIPGLPGLVRYLDATQYTTGSLALRIAGMIRQAAARRVPALETLHRAS